MLSKLQSILKALTMGRKGGGYYAVQTGRKTGIFRTWAECESHVKGFTGARFKKFSTEDEAENFVSGSTSGFSGYSTAPTPNQESRKRSFYEMSDSNHCDDTGYNYSSSNTKYYKPCSTSSVASSSWNSWTSSSSSSTNKASSSDSRPVVYTDGCCTKNGRNGARAGIGVYWGPKNIRNVSDRLEGAQTNQRAEIMAAVKALETAKDLGYKTLEIKTDSKYTINGATDWSSRWKKNGWKTVNGTEVKNKNEFQQLVKLCDEVDVKWTHVPGHRGIAGNEAADSLANAGSSK